MKKYSIIVILYNDLPKSYIYEINDGHVIVVDNTPKRDLKLISNNITYIPLKENKGIATALNIGFREAIINRSEWVLTMDQDSIMPKRMIEMYIDFINNTKHKIGIIAPLINMYKGENKQKNNSYIEITEALTSGSFISTEAYIKVGGFKDELFIDAVDQEFCWNILSNGFRIFQLNNVVMQHQLGETEEIKFLGFHLLYVTHHNYIRHYYMQRNGMYIRRLYNKHMFGQNGSLLFSIKSLFKILLFEEDKFRKINARYIGLKDYKNNIFGKLNHLL